MSLLSKQFKVIYCLEYIFFIIYISKLHLKIILHIHHPTKLSPLFLVSSQEPKL